MQVSKEDIKKARQVTIAEYLMSKGVQLQKVGRRYRHKEYDSLVFTDNAYYWNSKQEHGNALDYATKYLNMDFTEAVKELSQFNNRSPIKNTEKDFKINDIELNPNMQRAVAYLGKTRNIDYTIIQDLIKNKLLYQDRKYNNIIFPIKNEMGNVVGAELNGTLSDRRYKGIAENSEYGYGYNIRTSDIKDLKHYMFFESAIDLISYINIQQMKGNIKRLKNCLFISMGGLKINVVKHTLKAFKSENKPNTYLCIDNDIAGRNFYKTLIKELRYELDSENIKTIKPKNGKDWNEQLKIIKQAKGDLIMEKKHFSYEEEIADRLGLDDEFQEFIKSKKSVDNLKVENYKEIWVEYRESSNYVDDLESKKNLVEYLSSNNLVKDSKLINNDSIKLIINSKSGFEKANSFCNTRNRKYLFYGEINFLGNNGKVGETIHYMDKKSFDAEVADSKEVGRPITTKIYGSISNKMLDAVKKTKSLNRKPSRGKNQSHML